MSSIARLTGMIGVVLTVAAMTITSSWSQPVTGWDVIVAANAAPEAGHG